MNPAITFEDLIALEPLILANPAENDPRLRAAQCTLENAAAGITGPDYKTYYNAWLNAPATADALESAHPVLQFLRRSAQRIIHEVRTTPPPSTGILLWHVYNMGFVGKTASTTFGIDLHLRDAALLAPLLDALFISHHHMDHNTPGLADEMLRQRKPVISNFAPNSSLITEPATLDIRDLHVSIDLGDHFFYKPDHQNDMFMFRIQSPDGTLLYHTGDNSNAKKLLPTTPPPDAFVFHVNVGLDAPTAFARLQPKLAVATHLLELGHDVGNYRWPFCIAQQHFVQAPHQPFWIPLWGQRRHLIRTI